MKARSHHTLGCYLADSYFFQQSTLRKKAFLFGCTEPDKNPATYLKGSLHQQWLRGHNWGNSQKYMQKLAEKLEKREKLGVLDFYKLGKLIHYTADAFTFAHNPEFPTDLSEHRRYEYSLQDRFLSTIPETPCHAAVRRGSIMDTIRAYHADYEQSTRCVEADCRYALVVCCTILYQLLILPCL